MFGISRTWTVAHCCCSCLRPAARRFMSTAMMSQWSAVKEQYPNHIVFFRMGDFFELFHEDAEKMSQLLGITLSSRGKGKGKDVPLAGFPHFAIDSYLERVVRAGYMVVIVEQTGEGSSNSKLRHREVVRIETPATLTNDGYLDPRRNNFLCAVYKSSDGQKTGVAWTDVSTGEFWCCSSDDKLLEADIYRIHPVQIIVRSRKDISVDVIHRLFMVTEASDFKLSDTVSAEKTIASSSTRLQSLSHEESHACSMILSFLIATQKLVPHLQEPARFVRSAVLHIDASSRRSLEILKSQNGDRETSLLSAIDLTRTGPGSRLLASRICSPSTDLSEIKMRLSNVQHFVDLGESVRKKVMSVLDACSDLERSTFRLVNLRGGPRDLVAVGQTLARCADLQSLLNTQDFHFPCLRELMHQLQSALHPDAVEKTLESGGYIRSGFNEVLDQRRRTLEGAKEIVASLQAKYRSMTGIPNLVVEENAMWCAVKKSHGPKMEILKNFTLIGSTKEVYRYSSSELLRVSGELTLAKRGTVEIESDIFTDLVGFVSQHIRDLLSSAHLLAEIDFYCGAAELAVTHHYCRPDIVLQPILEVHQGRHPVVESVHAKRGLSFSPNSVDLNESAPFWLITGANMGGKSTFLRQNAIICIMAQAGMFVPATSCRIGVVDKLFSRVGASDDLARDQSTFMVEMLETASILSNCSPSSLVICDELGRGTSPEDGVAISQAVLEDLLLRAKCRTLFATHFLKLSSLSARYPSLLCFSFGVDASRPQPVFSHKLVRGPARSSYGIIVSRLAGLPEAVTNRAQALLKASEASASLNPAPVIGSEKILLENLIHFISSFDPDSHTPKQAHHFAYQLRQMLDRHERDVPTVVKELSLRDV
ncbi:mitochondrial DNA mismatch repair protein MutS [Andalucia godoyi]|uniref:Mitochondrial DNA mismatch repair protein MutS n=1 Tax=Andalucia godoyi TaxID=505711 RepID=A0A8K0AJE8_ANDGO|nr:mitochondrial DNA mismatch repair protein MutS [Andalucia godoyi]|eukprot:ANDGO_00623.mRNA.1 mitochondrial DNA mismatch repair protein MutS